MENRFIYILIISLFIIILFPRELPAAEMRNPFMDYRLSKEFIDEEVTLEIMKENLPFKLLGIITSNDDRIAIISTGGETKIINSTYEVDNYKLLNIGEKNILVGYQKLRAYLEIGGDLIAAGK